MVIFLIRHLMPLQAPKKPHGLELRIGRRDDNGSEEKDSMGESVYLEEERLVLVDSAAKTKWIRLE